MGRSTSIRLGALQLCPVFCMTCRTPRSTARSSASAKTRFAPLPPSSSVTRLNVFAAAITVAAASWWPARDAMRSDPVRLLRND